MVDRISTVCLIYTFIGVGVWLFSYVSFCCLIIFSERVGVKIRTKYLEAILKQDCTWFDTNNPSELSAKLTKEV